MAPGKVIEVQRVDAGDAGWNADVLNADGDEDEDQQIGQQGSEHEDSDGSFWRPAFSSETDGKVPDEHALSLIAHGKTKQLARIVGNPEIARNAASMTAVLRSQLA